MTRVLGVRVPLFSSPETAGDAPSPDRSSAGDRHLPGRIDPPWSGRGLSFLSDAIGAFLLFVILFGLLLIAEGLS